MKTSDGYLEFVRERLECVGEVSVRKMFGGAGVYLGGVFFALIADDVLYFKVDDANRPDYEAAGMGPFKPWRDKPHVMSYHQVPIEVLEDDDLLRVWARKALSAARAKPPGRSGRRRRPRG